MTTPTQHTPGPPDAFVALERENQRLMELLGSQAALRPGPSITVEAGAFNETLLSDNATLRQRVQELDAVLRSIINGQVRLSNKDSKLYTMTDHLGYLSEHDPKVIEARRILGYDPEVTAALERGSK